MRRWFMLAAFVIPMFLPAGCATVAYDERERAHRYDVIVENDFKQMGDDWDAFWLMDRSSRLSKWKQD